MQRVLCFVRLFVYIHRVRDRTYGKWPGQKDRSF